MRNSTDPHSPAIDATDNGTDSPAVPDSDAPAGPLGDRYIRAATVAVVIVLTAVAFYVSYRHLFDLSTGHGEAEDTARLFPLTIDGVIIMASLIMLYCARMRLPVPLLARVALWSGILATLAANAAHGWAGGWGGRLISAAPAAALILAYELLMWLIRTMKKTAPEQVHERVVYRDRPVEVPVEIEVELIPSGPFEAARWTVAEAVRTGTRRPGRRNLASQWRLEQREAEEILVEFAPPPIATPPMDPAEQPAVQPLVPIDLPVVVNGSQPVHELRP